MRKLVSGRNSTGKYSGFSSPGDSPLWKPDKYSGKSYCIAVDIWASRGLEGSKRTRTYPLWERIGSISK
jgi:hypothetical protein